MPVATQDPYRTLGVPHGAGLAECERAHRELLKQWHPDRYIDPAEKRIAQERTARITEALELIKGGTWYVRVPSPSQPAPRPATAQPPAPRPSLFDGIADWFGRVVTGVVVLAIVAAIAGGFAVIGFPDLPFTATKADATPPCWSASDRGVAASQLAAPDREFLEFLNADGYRLPDRSNVRFPSIGTRVNFVYDSSCVAISFSDPADVDWAAEDAALAELGYTVVRFGPRTGWEQVAIENRELLR